MEGTKEYYVGETKSHKKANVICSLSYVEAKHFKLNLSVKQKLQDGIIEIEITNPRKGGEERYERRLDNGYQNVVRWKQ